MLKVFFRKIRTFFVLICWKQIKLAISSFVYHLSEAHQKDLQILKALKGVHSGKRIFIVLNGPSLRSEDLDLLAEHGEITIGCNKISPIFQYTKWRPTYYTLMDSVYKEDDIGFVDAAESKYKFMRRDSFIFTRKLSGNKVYLKAKGSRKYLKAPKFSSDLSKYIYTIGTVAYAMLQMAVYMGASEIYIIGCDLSYAGNVKKHGETENATLSSYFKGTDPKYQNCSASVGEMITAFNAASLFMEQLGIKVFNATRGGHLEAFPRASFDELFD